MWIQDITKARSFSGRLESPCETRGGFIRSILCASAAGGSERVGAGGIRVSAVWQRSAEVLSAAGAPPHFLSQTL